MNEVGHSGEGQEEDLGSCRHHQDPEGAWPKGVRHHWGIPREEGGVVDGTRASTIPDGIERIA